MKRKKLYVVITYNMGENKKYYDNGQLKSVRYSINSPMGTIERTENYYDDGQLKSVKRTLYSHDIFVSMFVRKKQGEQQGWYKNGNQKYIKNYDDGKEEGEQRGWYENGNLKYITRYTYGTEDEEQKEWYENGNLKYIKNYIADVDHCFDRGEEYAEPYGEQKEWFENGNLKYILNIINGELCGEQQECNEDGSVRFHLFIFNGRIVFLKTVKECIKKMIFYTHKHKFYNVLTDIKCVPAGYNPLLPNGGEEYQQMMDGL